MRAMTGPTSNPWEAPQGYGAPPPPPPAGYPAPGHGAPAYGAPQPGWQDPPGEGPVGKVRPTGKAILLFVVTLGIYSYVYNYKVHKEMKDHSGRGVGGGVALLLTFVAGIAMPFVTSAEVGALYARRGLPEPVRGWTGLWFLLPVIGGYMIMIIAVVALSAAAGPSATASDAEAIGFAVGFGLFLLVAIAGAVVWFVKTNGALNRYWQGVAQR